MPVFTTGGSNYRNIDLYLQKALERQATIHLDALNLDRIFYAGQTLKAYYFLGPEFDRLVNIASVII